MAANALKGRLGCQRDLRAGSGVGERQRAGVGRHIDCRRCGPQERLHQVLDGKLPGRRRDKDRHCVRRRQRSLLRQPLPVLGIAAALQRRGRSRRRLVGQGRHFVRGTRDLGSLRQRHDLIQIGQVIAKLRRQSQPGFAAHARSCRQRRIEQQAGHGKRHQRQIAALALAADPFGCGQCAAVKLGPTLGGIGSGNAKAPGAGLCTESKGHQLAAGPREGGRLLALGQRQRLDHRQARVPPPKQGRGPRRGLAGSRLLENGGRNDALGNQRVKRQRVGLKMEGPVPKLRRRPAAGDAAIGQREHKIGQL